MVFHLDPSSSHYLPLLPRGDPSKPRAQPNHSVMDLARKNARRNDTVRKNGTDRSKRTPALGGGSLHLGPVLPQGPSSPKPPMGISSSSNM